MADRDTHDYARERIKSSLTMEDILDAYYYTSPRKKICCPFHEEQTPSFSYKDDYYTCFGGCGAKGDTITFVQSYFNLTYTEALQKMDADFHLNVYNDESWKNPEAIKKTQAALEQRRKAQQEQFAEQDQINALYDEIADLERACDMLRPPKGREPEEKAVIAYLAVQENLRDKEVLLEEILTMQYAKRYQERSAKENRKQEQATVNEKTAEGVDVKMKNESKLKEFFGKVIPSLVKEKAELPSMMGENGLPITLEEYESPPTNEADDMKPRYFSPPEIPGWQVQLYNDGSGCFITPEGKEMYIFDKFTGEYKDEQGRWTDFFDDPGVPFSGDENLVDKLVKKIAKSYFLEENIEEKEIYHPQELPGWEIIKYRDGSGHFLTPDKEKMYEFDESTGEYKDEQGKWTFYSHGPEGLITEIMERISDRQTLKEKSDTEIPKAEAKNTVVVNLVAGPGAGKTTCSWEIAEKLKKQGYVVEYVSEVAKDYVWDENWEMLDGSKKNQIALFEEQKHKIDRLIGKVDFIVTDSPLLLNAVYLTEGSEQEIKGYKSQVNAAFNEYNNFVIFIERGKDFEQAGRIHNEEQSRELDNQVKKMLEDNGVYYGTYRHDTIDVSIANMIKTLKRTQKSEAQNVQVLKIEEESEIKSDIKVPTEKEKTAAMLLSADIYPLKSIATSENGNRLLANVKVQLNQQLEFSAKIIEKKNGEKFISIPQYCTNDGNFQQIVHLEKKLYERVQGEILGGYTENKPAHIKSGEQQPVDLKIKRMSLTDYEKIKGFAEVSIGDVITVSRIKVIDGAKGIFAAMPTMAAYTDNDGKKVYPEAITVLDNALQKQLNSTVITAYKDEAGKQMCEKEQGYDEDESSIEKYINYTNNRAAEKEGVKQMGVMPQQADNGRGLE